MTMKKNRNWVYHKICKYCGKPFEAETRYRRVCDICKEQNRKKIWDGYYKKYIERRLKKKDGIKRMDAKKN